MMHEKDGVIGRRTCPHVAANPVVYEVVRGKPVRPSDYAGLKCQTERMVTVGLQYHVDLGLRWQIGSGVS